MIRISLGNVPKGNQKLIEILISELNDFNGKIKRKTDSFIVKNEMRATDKVTSTLF